MAEPHPVVPQDPPDKSAQADSAFPDTSAPLPPELFPVTVEGRKFVHPDSGFGQLWHKRYRVRLSGANVSPTEVIDTWRSRFGEFWPSGSRFYRPVTGLEPGEVALIDLAMPAGTRLSTGVVVIGVTPTSFTYATAPGHTFAGRITFSAYDEAGTTVAQIEMLLRTSDPLFDLALLLGGNLRDDRFWEATLRNLAAAFGASSEPSTMKERLDRRRRWRNATNITQNSLLRTATGLVGNLFRAGATRIRGGKDSGS